MPSTWIPAFAKIAAGRRRPTFLPTLLRLAEYPCVALIRDFGQNQQIFASKGIGGLPFVGVLFFVDPRKGGVEPVADGRFVLPDGRFDGANPDLVYRFVFGHNQVQ